MVRPTRFVAFAVLASLLVAACAPGATTPGAGTTITVMSLWGGSEQESFQKVLDAFKAKTQITANYESVRQNYATTLQTRISGGNPPDVAIIPGIGFLRQFARQGSLKKISDLGIDVNGLKPNYPPGILEIGQVDATQYAIMVKFNSKSTFWYRPEKLSAASIAVPTDWDSFKAALAKLALVLVSSSQSHQTAPLGLSFFAGAARAGDPTKVAAAAVLVAAPILVVYLVLQRHFVRGMLAGAIKE